MADTLKLLAKSVALFTMWIAVLAVGLKVADWMGFDTGTASAAANMTPQELAMQRVRMEQAYTVRALARHRIPPGTSAMCDAKDQLIGYYVGDGVVVYDDARDRTPVQCW